MLSRQPLAAANRALPMHPSQCVCSSRKTSTTTRRKVVLHQVDLLLQIRLYFLQYAAILLEKTSQLMGSHEQTGRLNRMKANASPASQPPMQLDDLDRRILKVLQRDNQISMSNLAEEVSSTTPTCVRRVKRLRKQGAILADVSVINPRLAGSRMTMIVQVEVERERPDLIEGFKRLILSCDEVSESYYVTGDVDFVLIVQVRDMEHYEKFIDKVFYSSKNVKQFKTFITIRRVKYTTEILID